MAPSTAPLERRVALVLDERAREIGGESGGRIHHATLEFEDGARTEVRVPAHLAGPLQQGDAGVAYFRGEELADFRRAL